MYYRPPGSSVHGIFQAKILEWVAISFSKGSSWLRDRNCSSYKSPAMQADSLLLSHLGRPTSSSLGCKKGMLPLLTSSALHHKPLCVTLFGHFHRQKPSSHHCLPSLSLGSWYIKGTEWNLLGRTNFLALSMPTYSLTPLSPACTLFLFFLLFFPSLKNECKYKFKWAHSGQTLKLSTVSKIKHTHTYISLLFPF